MSPALIQQQTTAPSHDARSGREDHCKRVGALAKEMGYVLNLVDSAPCIEPVAWFHDWPRELFLEKEVHPSSARSLDDRIVDGMRAFHGRPVANDDSALIGEVVNLANSLDEMMEWLPFEHQSMDDVLAELSAINRLNLWRPEVESALHQISTDQMQQAIARAEHLPVSAIGSVRKMATIAAEDLTVETLCRTTANDPVLAGDLLRSANSCAYPNLLRRTSSIKEAIIHLGAKQSRAVLLSSAARGIFGSNSMRGLWKHSVEVAAYAAELAILCGCDREDAFTAGLLHDIGRLAIEKLDRQTLERRARLTEQQLPTVWIDLVTCRHDHAEIGGALLESWKFPMSTVEAVACHHSPERTKSKLAAVVYLAELRAGEHEDSPSLVKNGSALATTGLSLADVQGVRPRDQFSAILAS
jgi:putative nucleotidyltransferase with HDIG domain